MAQLSLFRTDKDAFKNSNKNLTVGSHSPTIDLIKTKIFFIGKAAVPKGVVKGRPA